MVVSSSITNNTRDLLSSENKYKELIYNHPFVDAFICERTALDPGSLGLVDRPRCSPWRWLCLLWATVLWQREVSASTFYGVNEGRWRKEPQDLKPSDNSPSSRSLFSSSPHAKGSGHCSVFSFHPFAVHFCSTSFVSLCCVAAISAGASLRVLCRTRSAPSAPPSPLLLTLRVMSRSRCQYVKAVLQSELPNVTERLPHWTEKLGKPEKKKFNCKKTKPKTSFQADPGKLIWLKMECNNLLLSHSHPLLSKIIYHNWLNWQNTFTNAFWSKSIMKWHKNLILISNQELPQ